MSQICEEIDINAGTSQGRKVKLLFRRHGKTKSKSRTSYSARPVSRLCIRHVGRILTSHSPEG